MVLIDTNVIVDLLVQDSEWFEWSSARTREVWPAGAAINQLILGEIATQFATEEAMYRALPRGLLKFDLPWEAAFIAGRKFMAYRKRGGTRLIPFPDFYIGAHALVSNFTLLTRDSQFYKTNFPEVRLICP